MADDRQDRLMSASWIDWVYPLPTLTDGREATISDGFSAIETADHRQHLGVDIMYRRVPSEVPALPRGTKLFYTPENTPVVAAYGGKIWNTNITSLGHSITIDHGDVPEIGPAVTFYQHMASFARDWKKGDVIRPGDVLGIVGGPIIGYPLHHLHFELWLPTRDEAIDPEPFMTKWARRHIGQLSIPAPVYKVVNDVVPERGGGIRLSTPLVIGIAATGLLVIGLAIGAASGDDVA